MVGSISRGGMACLAALLTLGIVAGAMFLVAWGFQWAWNVAVPAMFNGPTIGYWPAFGACLLLSIVANYFSRRSKS
jgi:hypothetical protein